MSLRTPEYLARVTRPEPGSWLDLTARKGLEYSIERRRLQGIDEDEMYLVLAHEIAFRVKAWCVANDMDIDPSMVGFEDSAIRDLVADEIAIIEEDTGIEATEDTETVDMSWVVIAQLSSVLHLATVSLGPGEPLMMWPLIKASQDLVTTMATVPPTSVGLLPMKRAVLEKAADTLHRAAANGFPPESTQKISELLISAAEEMRLILYGE